MLQLYEGTQKKQINITFLIRVSESYDFVKRVNTLTEKVVQCVRSDDTEDKKGVSWLLDMASIRSLLDIDETNITHDAFLFYGKSIESEEAL